MTPMIIHHNKNQPRNQRYNVKPANQPVRQAAGSQPADSQPASQPTSQPPANQRASKPAASQPTSQPDLVYAMPNSKSPKHYHNITILSPSKINGAVFIHICDLYCILFISKFKSGINLSVLVSGIESRIKSPSELICQFQCPKSARCSSSNHQMIAVLNVNIKIKNITDVELSNTTYLPSYLQQKMKTVEFTNNT